MSRQTSSYEPFRHTGKAADDDHAEKLLDPAQDSTYGRRLSNAGNTNLAANDYLDTSLPDRPALKPPRSHLRIFLRIVGFLLAASIVGIQAYAAYKWLATRHDTYLDTRRKMRIKSWAHLDVWPTWTMLGARVLGTLVHLCALLTLTPCFRGPREGRLHSVLVYLSSLLLIAAFLAAAIYFKIADNMETSKRTHWDLWSWACHQSKAKTGGKAISWGSLCVQQKATFFASIAVLVLEVFSVLVFIGLQRGFSVASKSNTFGPGKWKGYASLNRRR